jgi:L-rhamnose isomerase
MMPLGMVWDEYLARQNLDDNYLEVIRKYEEEVLLKRN